MKSIMRNYFLLVFACLLFQTSLLLANDNCKIPEKWDECNYSLTPCDLPLLLPSDPKHIDFTNGQGWTPSRHIRTVGDVNGDGKTDIIGFGENSISVSFGEGNGKFSYPKPVLYSLTIGRGGWAVEQNPRMLADVDGDGKDDIVGFGHEGVAVAFSNGQWFSKPKLLYKGFSTAYGGFKGNRHPRMMADVNGDGKADIVGFGEADVKVALSKGRSFDTAKIFAKDFCAKQGWGTARHIRTMGDVNGDDKADIVAFGENGVRIALSTGTAFGHGKTILKGKVSIVGGGWKVLENPRMLADVNGDGKDDLVAFGTAGVQVGYSTGNGFTSPKELIKAFGYNAGKWRGANQTRLAADLNNDGKADILGFGGNNLFRSYSTGNGFQNSHKFYFEINTKTIKGITKSQIQHTTKGKIQSYNFNRQEFENMMGTNGKVAGLSMNFTPKSAYIDNEGFLYVYLNMEGSSIDMTKFANHDRTKGYYLKEVAVSLEAEGMHKFRASPINISQEGVYGTSKEFNLGTGIAAEGAGGGGQYSWGSNFSTTVKDFQFVNQTKQSNQPKFSWSLGKVGNAAKGESPGIYTNFRSLGIQSASQYTSLKHLPPLASENFPIDCEGIFRKRVNSNAIPDKTKVRIYIKATFEKARLVSREESAIESFLNGFIFFANPRTYDGEQFYEFKNDLQITENYIDVELDLSDLKQ